MSTYDSINFYRNLKFEERDYLNNVLNSLSLYIFLDSYMLEKATNSKYRINILNKAVKHNILIKNVLDKQFFYTIGGDGYKILSKSNKIYRELNIMCTTDELESILSLNEYLINNNIDLKFNSFLDIEIAVVNNSAIHTCNKQKAINSIKRMLEKESKEPLTNDDILDNYEFVFVEKCFDLLETNSVLNERLNIKNISKTQTDEEYKI